MLEDSTRYNHETIDIFSPTVSPDLSPIASPISFKSQDLSHLSNKKA